MNKLICGIVLICISISAYGQKFAVPEGVLDGVVSKQFEYTYTAKFDYKIVYPANYDSLKTYKVFLGLSGGNANDKIVDYCYYTLFDSKYFDDYLTILPIGPSGRPLSEIDKKEMDLLVSDIMKNQKVTSKDWIVAGTSMGGLASFHIASMRPDLFEGIITFPGGFHFEEIPEEWSSYKVLLAAGELDEEDWTKLNQETKEKLEGKVKWVETFTIEGQEHIIAPEYDIDKVYRIYFDQ